jgi:hypothetical protein
MQVDAPADYVVGVGRMNDDGVVIGNLLFAQEMFLVDSGPIVAAISAAKDASSRSSSPLASFIANA